jgi:phospholipase D1/2
MDTRFPSALTPLGTSSQDLPDCHPQKSFAFGGLADAVTFLVNGQPYFARLAETLRQARNSILIVGWDFNPDILLQPGLSSESLGDLLQAAVRSNPGLEVRILVWAMGPIYSQKSLRLFYRRDFPAHPRIRMLFARHDAWHASHHQKLVSVDDAVGFIGGIDLTSRRFDDRRHAPADSRRRDTSGRSYDPLHDVQAMVTGEAARQIGQIIRRRWIEWGGDSNLAPVPAPVQHVLHSPVAARRMPAAFALTQREDLADGGVSEGLRMTLDIIRSASRYLYIETQYLASQTIAKALAARLLEDEGPEIVIICTRSSHGFIEQLVMGRNRRRVIRRLKQADRHGRLRVFYPVVPDKTGEIEVLVHSKLLIADDQSLRIGSSNLNHRSEGLDTECDMRLDATTPDHAAAIATLRCQLLAEHLGTSTESVAAKVDEVGSIIRAIDALNEGRGRLKALDADVGPGPLCPVIGTALFDPTTARSD